MPAASIRAYLRHNLGKHFGDALCQIANDNAGSTGLDDELGSDTANHGLFFSLERGLGGPGWITGIIIMP